MGGKAPKKMPVCRFFNSAQGCAKGRRCPFRHVPFTGGGGHGGGGRRGAHQLAKRKPAFPKFLSMASLGQALPFAGGTVKITKGKGGRSVTAKQVVKTVQYVKAPGSAPKAPPKPKTVACIFVQDESGLMGGAKERAAKAEIVRIVNDVLLPNHYVGVLGFANDVLGALCKPMHAQYLRVGAAGAKDLGAEVRRAFAVVERQLLRVVTTEVRTVTVSQGRKGGGGGRGKPKGRKPQKGRGRR